MTGGYFYSYTSVLKILTIKAIYFTNSSDVESVTMCHVEIIKKNTIISQRIFRSSDTCESHTDMLVESTYFSYSSLLLQLCN